MLADELKARLRVLRRLGYLDNGEMEGRAAGQCGCCSGARTAGTGWLVLITAGRLQACGAARHTGSSAMPCCIICCLVALCFQHRLEPSGQPQQETKPTTMAVCLPSPACLCILPTSAAAMVAVLLLADGLVTSKGRLAAELSSGHDELVLAELLLGGAFSELSPDQLVALCSCFVWSEKSQGSHK